MNSNNFSSVWIHVYTPTHNIFEVQNTGIVGEKNIQKRSVLIKITVLEFYCKIQMFHNSEMTVEFAFMAKVI